MRSVFGPLVFGLGLLWVAGCALPNQQLGRSEGLGLKFKERPKPGLSSKELDADELTFKSRNRRSESANKDSKTELAELEQDLAGLQAKKSPSDETFTIGHSVERTSTTSKDDQVTQVGWDQNATVETLDTTKMVPFGQSKGPGSRDVSGVTLEGVEAVESSPAAPKGKAKGSVPGSDRHPLARSDATSRPAKDEVRNWVDRLPELRPAQRKSRRGGNDSGSEIVEQATHSDQMHSLSKPVTERTPLAWQAELEQLIARAEQDVSQWSSESAEGFEDRQRKQIYLRLLYLMAEHQEQALTAIPELTANQQEYWQQMIWAMSNSLDSVQFPDAASRAAQTIPPLSNALRQMREEASLSIKNISFCRKISYFGNYERFQRNEFTPGQEVLLYSEVENFVSVPTSDGEHRTSLKSLIEIVDQKGTVVWTKAFAATEDFCRNPRRDYFHNYQFRIPDDISMGTYVLKLSITDELSQKKALSSLTFVLK